MRRLPNQFRVPVSRSATPPPVETIPAYWHPNRGGVRKAPSWFMEKIEELGWHEIDVTWNPLRERWQVFSKAPNVSHPICPGWRLLFIHEGPDGEHLPLDERVLARLYHCSAMAYGSGVAYFDRLIAEMERDREKRSKQDLQDTMDQAIERGWDHTRISTAGQGNKFSKYHA